MGAWWGSIPLGCLQTSYCRVILQEMKGLSLQLARITLKCTAPHTGYSVRPKTPAQPRTLKLVTLPLNLLHHVVTTSQFCNVNIQYCYDCILSDVSSQGEIFAFRPEAG